MNEWVLSLCLKKLKCMEIYGNVCMKSRMHYVCISPRYKYIYLISVSPYDMKFVFRFYDFQSERFTIHKNLCLSLFVAEIVFIVGVTETNNSLLCSMVAVMLHYFFLCAFVWMLLEGKRGFETIYHFRAVNFSTHLSWLSQLPRVNKIFY